MEALSRKMAVGVDLGGTTIHTALVTLEGQLIAHEHCLTDAIKGVDTVIAHICDSIRNVCAKGNIAPDDLLAIGIGSPGPLSTKTGIVIDAPNLNGWVNVPLRDLVQQSFKAPIFLDNDANAAAYGEFWVGAGKGVQNLIAITLGTGIGGGLIIDGKLFRGPDDTSGEIGHTTVLLDGPPCNCGSQGCLEALSSATALVRRAVESLKSGSSSLLNQMSYHDYSKISSKMIYDAAVQGDLLSIELLRETGFYIGVSCASWVNVLNPEMIILFGGMMGAGEFIITPIREEIRKRAFPQPAARVKIVPAILGNDAGAIGAAGIALAEFYPKP